MDVHAATGDDRTLRRIIALLVSLAVLAERAAGRCLPVRWFVVWLLRRAETAATDYVFEETGLPPLVLEGFTAAGDGYADALGLAARFRTLAALLVALLPVADPPDRWSARRRLASGGVARGFGRPLDGRRPRPIDTS